MGNAKCLALGADLHFPGASVSKGYAHVPTPDEILMNPTKFFFSFHQSPTSEAIYPGTYKA